MGSKTLLKIGGLIAPLVASGVLLGVILNKIYLKYRILFLPGQALLELALWAFGAILVSATFGGLVAALVRPWWLAVLGFALSAFAMVIAWEISPIPLIAGFVYLVLATLYTRSLIHELDARLDFSIRPISEEQKLLFLALTLLVAVSFARGYATDARQQGFILPPEAKEAMINMTLPSIQAQIEGQPELGPRERTTALNEAREQTEKFWAETEEQIEPYAQYIPLALAMIILTTFQTLLGLLAWIPTTVLSIIFSFLKTWGITHIIIETKEVKRLELG